MTIHLKRAYEEAVDSDGFRVLVERLWPRGVSKEKAHLDLWAKELAPSTELRKWYDHEPAKWPEFQRRYRAELHEKGEALRGLENRAFQGTVTFVFAARDEERNSAQVLKEYLEERGSVAK